MGSPISSNNPQLVPKTPWFVYFGAVLVFCPALVYFYSIYIYATNIPFSDDFPISLDSIISIIQFDSLQKKLTYIFSHNLELLLLFQKVIILSIYSIWGEIDLKTPLFIGNSTLLGFLFFAYKMMPEKRERVFLVLPAALILFQLKPNWVYMIWSVNVGRLYSFFFAGLVFYFLNKRSTNSFLGAYFFAICAVVNGGAGAVVIPTGWIMLIIQKRFKLAWVWLVGNLTLIGFYSYWGGFMDALSSSQFSISSLNDLAGIGLFFISFLGSMFSFENQTIIFTSGVIMVCHFIFLIYKKYYVINLTVFCFMIYIILLAATAAMYRSGMGENAVLADRYKIHSLIMVLMIYISLVDLFYSRINRKWVFVTSMVLMTGSMYFISYSEGKQKLEYSKYFLVWRTNQWLDQNYNLPAQPYQSQANAIMTRALTSGYYRLPHQLLKIPNEKYSPLVSSIDLCTQESKTPFKSDFNVITVGPKLSPFLVRIEGMIYDQKPVLSNKPEPVRIVLISSKGKYIFTAHSQKYIKKSIHYRQKTMNKGLLALIPFNKLKDNIYRLGLCYREEVVFSNHFIIKQNHQFKYVVK